jgi:hypothetical protein
LSFLYCPSCGLANSDTTQRCYACARVLIGPVDTTSDAAGGASESTENEPAYLAPRRTRLARAASKALASAAIMSIIRGFLMPYLITRTPPGTFGSVDTFDLQIKAFGGAVAFGVAAVWALSDPLTPTLAAGAIYLGLAIPDAITGTGLLGKGLISKCVMLMVFGRALTAAIQHHWMKRPQDSPSQ